MAMTFHEVQFQALDDSGNPVSGALLNFYLTGTTTRTDTYTDSALSVAHANPVEANAAGRFAPIYLNPSVTYKAVLTTSAGVQIGDTLDPVDSGSATGTFTVTLTGISGADPTGTARWVRNGNAVTLYIPSLTGTSDATTATLTGMPTTIRPARTQISVARVTENGTTQLGLASIATDGVISLFATIAGAAFTASGTKSHNEFTYSYSLV